MKNAFLSRQSVDSHSTLIRGSFLASFAKRFAAFAFVLFFAIPQMWGAETPAMTLAVSSDTKIGAFNTTYGSGNNAVTLSSTGAAMTTKKACGASSNIATYSISSADSHWLEFSLPSTSSATISSIVFRISGNSTGTSDYTAPIFYCKESSFNVNKVSGVTNLHYTGYDQSCSDQEVTFVDGVKSCRLYRRAKYTAPTSAGDNGKVGTGSNYSCSNQTMHITYIEVYLKASAFDVKFFSDAEKKNQVGTTKSVTAGGKATAPADPSKTGYEFAGWTVNGTDVVNVSEYAINAATDFIAKWTAQTTHITLDKNGGSADGSATATYDGGISDYDAAKPAGEGQTLLGYFSATTDGNKIIDASGNLVADKWTITDPTMTLYAQWATSCTVRFMANGEVFDTQTVGLGGNATTPEGTPEAPTGKGFGGWSETDGGAVVDVESITINGNKDFYVVWNDLRTVSFATGCSASSIDPVTVIDGQPVAKPADPTRTNWEITKWQLEGADYDFSTPVTSDIELTAVWQRKTISGSTEDITVSDGTTLNQGGKLSVGLGKGSLSTGNGGIKFNYGINSSNSGTNYITFTVPANHTATIKTLTLHDANPVIVTDNNTDISSPLYDSSDPKSVTFTEGTYYMGRKSSSTYLKKLVISLTSSPITATFKDGESTVATVSATANEELGNLFLDCELPVLADHDGMTFLGWYNGENPVAKATTISASTTYTAKWKGEEHTLTWTIGEGATVKTEGTPAGQVEAGTPLTAPVVEREGYRFDGWSPEVPAVMPNDDAEYVAQWVKVFNVTYMDGETELGKEIVDEGQKAANYAQYQNQSLKEFKGWSDGESNPIYFTAKTIDADLVAYGSWDIAYAQSVDFMAAAHTNPQPAVADFLAANNYAVIPYGDVQWDTNPYDHRDCGLKFESKTDDREFAFWVSANRKVSIQIGSWQGYENESMPSVGTAELYMNGTKAEDIQAEAVNKYYTTEDTKFVIKVVDPYWSVIQKITIEDKPIVSDDVSLKDLTVNGVTIEGFAKNKTAYNVVLPYKTTSALVAAVANDENATVSEISQATSLPGIASFTVTAEDETTTADYTVNFTVAPKDGICLIKGQVTGQNTVTITVGEGTGAAKNVKNTSTYGDQTGYKLSSRPAYIGITLAEGQFQAGDVVNVFVTSVAVGNDGDNPVYQPMRVFSNNTTDDLASCLLVEKESNMVQGVNTVVLPEGCNTNTIYLCRGGADKTYDGWNPYIAYIEVTRPMNPMLTKATILDKEATIDESAKTVTVEVPYSADITAVTPAFEYISNDNSQVVISPAEAQDFTEAKTYRFTDKDGDYTEYTVSINKAEPSHDAKLKELKVGEDAITLIEGTYAYTYMYAYGAEVPTNVSATANSEVAKPLEITQATAQTKLASVVVTAEDGTTKQEYTITFVEKAQPAATPSIDVQPVGHDYLDTEVIAALTVEASTTDEGILSYQWYKGEETVGEDLPTYTPTEAGDYKVVVTNTLGEETATATSEVAVITITHAYTFASWNGEDNYFTKEGEWTMYSANSNGVIEASNNYFKADQQVNAAGDKANVYSGTKRFVIKFEKDMKQLELRAYKSTANYKLSFVRVSETATKGSYTDVQGETAADAGAPNYQFIINQHFEAGKYYWVELSNSMNIFDVFTAEAIVTEGPTAAIAAGTVNGKALSESELTNLNSNKNLTLTDKFLAEPVVELTQKVVTKYDDGFVKEVTTTQTAAMSSDADNFIATCTFDAQDYVIYCPINNDPAMALDVEAGSIALKGLVRSGEQAVKLTGLNLANGNYNVIVPAVAGLSIAPTSFTVADGAVDQEFTITYASDADVAEATANIEFTVGETTATYALTYSSAAVYQQASVSESTVWDFSKVSASHIELSTSTTPAKNEECVLANVEGVNNNDDFNAQALLFAGQHIGRDGNHVAGNYLKLTTTVPGMVTVTFSDNGSNNRHLDINGQESEASSGTGDKKTFSAAVDAGEIMIKGEDVGQDNTAYVRIFNITFTAAEVVRTGLRMGQFGTICYAKDAVAYFGAKFYAANGKEGTSMYFDEVEAGETLYGGQAYLFEATANQIALVFVGDDKEAKTEDTNGFYGVLVDTQVAVEAPDEHAWYGIYGNKIQPMATDVIISANRAYIVVDEVPAYEPQTTTSGAPRRRIGFGMSQVNTPTGGKDVFMQQGVHKFIRNNQMFIIREGRLYNAQGKMMR